MKNSIRLVLFVACGSFPMLFQACTRPLSPTSPFVPPTNTPALTGTFTKTSTSTFTGTSTFTKTSTFTSTPTSTSTNTGTSTFTPTATYTVAVSCSAQVTLTFTGNLNSAQRADQPGGVLQLGTAVNPILPIALPGNTLNGAKTNKASYQTGQALFQVLDLAQPPDGAPHALPNHAQALVTGAFSLSAARFNGTTSYAWNQGGTYPAACTVTKTVTDSLGAARQIKILFYQVNDLGNASPPVNPNPPHQVNYAWYAFEITGGLQPGNNTLIGGTGISEGDIPPANDRSQNRCVVGDAFWGDFVYFNTDGSLASEGGTWVSSGLNTQDKTYLYLPLDGNYFSSNSNNPQYVVELNFGSAGMLGYGKRDGITGDAAASSVN